MSTIVNIINMLLEMCKGSVFNSALFAILLTCVLTLIIEGAKIMLISLRRKLFSLKSSRKIQKE